MHKKISFFDNLNHESLGSPTYFQLTCTTGDSCRTLWVHDTLLLVHLVFYRIVSEQI